AREPAEEDEMDEDGERGSPREFREARRGLRAAIHDTQGVERLLAALPLRSGHGEIRLTWYQEHGRGPVVALWLYHRDDRAVLGGFKGDPKAGLADAGGPVVDGGGGRYVAVVGVAPVKSAGEAVGATILADVRSGG